MMFHATAMQLLIAFCWFNVGAYTVLSVGAIVEHYTPQWKKALAYAVTAALLAYLILVR